MNKFKQIIFLLFIALSMSTKVGISQGITVEAKLDTSIIMIGDQIKFYLHVEQDRSFVVDMPLFADTLVKDVEILERSRIDTTYLSDKILKLSQEFTITSFDSGFHVISAIPFPFRNTNFEDTIESRPLVLGVYTFQIDSIQGIADIKHPLNTPFTFKEALPYIGIGFGSLLVISLIIWLIWFFSRKEVQTVKREIPKEPPHVIALRDLDKLADKKLWQQSKFKEYHSELTEIIRIYIEFRFQIMAMEQTSDEVFQQFERNGLLSGDQFEILKQMLTLADFVKFAKYHPVPDENELSLKHAYDFVMKTKQKVDLTTKKEEVLTAGSQQPEDNGQELASNENLSDHQEEKKDQAQAITDNNPSPSISGDTSKKDASETDNKTIES